MTSWGRMVRYRPHPNALVTNPLKVCHRSAGIVVLTSPIIRGPSMQLKPNAYRLNETVKGVETMTRFALAVLALASGVYT